MSSILKALKKLEQETAANGNPPLPKRPRAPRSKRSASFVVPGLAALFLVILIAAGAAVFERKTADHKSPEHAVKDEKPAQSVTPPAETISQNRAAETETRKPPETAAAAPEFEFATRDVLAADIETESSESRSREPLGAPDSAMPEAGPETAYATDPFMPMMPEPDFQAGGEQDFQPEVASEAEPEMVSDIRPETQPEETQPPEETADAADERTQPVFETAVPDAEPPAVGESEPVVPAVTENSYSPQPAARKTEPPVAVIEDPDIELQAISWSADANKRMAIINGKICREKDRVGQYVIDAINSGDVVISKGSVKGRLVFKIR